MKVYAAYYNENTVRQQSSSGGIFSAIAISILKDNGVVYGVAMTKDCYSAEYIRVEKEDELKLLRGSKYLQAKVGDTYRNVEGDLKNGKMVLFSGTGCQINGLKKFLNVKYDSLVCVDVICHGVPSPNLWKQYALYQEKNREKLVAVDFRCKDTGWKSFGMKENEIYIPKEDSFYMQVFLKNYCLRPSCYKCKAKKEKYSDITIADFWGIDKILPEMFDDNGTSLVIVRTEKGESIWKKIEANLYAKEATYEEGVRNNVAEYSSAKKPKKRERFYVDLNNMNFNKFKKKYGASWGVRQKRKLKKFLQFFGGGHTEYSLHFTFLENDKSERNG